MKKRMCACLLAAALVSSGCGLKGSMKDGYYTAEMSGYSHGWKEYVCILVKDNQIVSVEFNAKDQNGYVKAWDNAYMQNMYLVNGTYPNEYTRYYAAELLERQDDSGVDILSGATSSGNNFNRLSAAAIQQAFKGNSDIVQVEIEAEE